MLFLFLDLEEYGLEIERTLSKVRTKKRGSKKKLAEEQTPRKQLMEYFTLATYDSPTSTRMPTITVPFEINHSLIQMLPSFCELDSKNPFKHVDVFLEICSTIFLHNIANDAF